MRLTPEARLVHRAAGPDANKADALASVAEDVRDWERVLAIAERELAAPALWRALSADARTSIPERERLRLTQLANVGDARNVHLMGRLRETLGELARRDVPVLLLKGAAVISATGNDPRARPMADLDVLVRPTDAQRAREAVLASGWRPSALEAFSDLYDAHHHLVPCEDTQVAGLCLELHTASVFHGDAFTLSDDEVWASARPAATLGASTLVPHPHHLLWHACTHFAWSHQMSFGAWRTFRTAAMLTDAGVIDWPSFAEAASASGAGRAVWWALRLANVLAGVEVPSSALDRLRQGPRDWIDRVAERHFIEAAAPGEFAPSPSVRVANSLWRRALALEGTPAAASAPDPTLEQAWQVVRGGGAAPVDSSTRLFVHLGRLGAWGRFAVRTVLGR